LRVGGVEVAARTVGYWVGGIGGTGDFQWGTHVHALSFNKAGEVDLTWVKFWEHAPFMSNIIEILIHI
jgi:hypothetical protein